MNGELVNDSVAWMQNLPTILLSFAAYFLGIVIRKIVFPKKSTLELSKQLLLGIPVSLVIVPPLVAVLLAAVQSNFPTAIVTLGVIMEHGMLLNETITRQLAKLGEKTAGGSGTTPGPAIR